MPRYRYKCSECETEAIVYHLYHETLDECLECRTPGAMVRQLTTPQYRKKTESVTRAGILLKSLLN